MQTQDVLARLKRATTDRVPSPTRNDRRRAHGELVAGDCCQNCGRDHGEATVDRRRLVPTESPDDGNEMTLCDACHADVPPSDGHDTAADAADACTQTPRAIDADAVRARDAHRCRGCGVRERIVVGSGLHVHPVVPIEAAGYRHAHNFVSLCPLCHRRLHD
jgi:hypothetical protein